MTIRVRASIALTLERAQQLVGLVLEADEALRDLCSSASIGMGGLDPYHVNP